MRVLNLFDPWGNPFCTCRPKYTLNPYTGCGHKCRYCYITSYIKDAFNPRLKNRLLRRLYLDLIELGVGGRVSISYSSDPYTPPEDKWGVMRDILKLFREFSWAVHIVTKSTLVLRDMDLLSGMKATVSITLTTMDVSLAKALEPGAPSPRDRLYAIEKLSGAGVPVSVRLDPIIPFVNDDLNMIREVIEACIAGGAKHIVTSIYKSRPDNLRRLISVIDPYLGRRLVNFYRNGFFFRGYRYAPSAYRYKILSLVRESVKRIGPSVTFNVCREGFRSLDDFSSFCDAGHLV